MTESLFLNAISPDLRGSAQDRERFAIDGREPQEVACPESVEQVAEVLRVACERRLAVVPVGYGAFLHLGGSPRRYDLALSVQRLDRIVDYQPADMTVTVEAGMTLARLQEVLGEHGQWLPIDPPLPEQAHRHLGADQLDQVRPPKVAVHVCCFLSFFRSLLSWIGPSNGRQPRAGAAGLCQFWPHCV